MAVMAVTVPLILGLVVVGSNSSRAAERETRAVMTARSVFEQVRLAREGNSALIEAEDLPWAADAEPSSSGAGAENSDWLILELNQTGDILGVAEGMGYEDAWQGSGVQVVGLAAVRGYFQQVENVEVTDGEPLSVFRVEVRVESPARATVASRERSVFIKSDSLR